jgi:hypothetical protein
VQRPVRRRPDRSDELRRVRQTLQPRANVPQRHVQLLTATIRPSAAREHNARARRARINRGPRKAFSDVLHGVAPRARPPRSRSHWPRPPFTPPSRAARRIHRYAIEYIAPARCPLSRAARRIHRYAIEYIAPARCPLRSRVAQCIHRYSAPPLSRCSMHPPLLHGVHRPARRAPLSSLSSLAASAATPWSTSQNAPSTTPLRTRKRGRKLRPPMSWLVRICTFIWGPGRRTHAYQGPDVKCALEGEGWLPIPHAVRHSDHRLASA